MDQSQLAILFEEAGPLLEDMAIIEYPDAGAFQLQNEDGLQIFVHRDAGRQCLVFHSDLGAPDAGAAASLYPMLLVMNAQWEQTGGLRFALEEDGGACCLYWDLPTSVLTPQSLMSAVQSFSDKVLLWRGIIANGARLSEGVDKEASAKPLQPSEIIRG